MRIEKCPFCGNVDQIDFELTRQTADKEGIPVALCCIQCGAYGPWLYADENGDDVTLMHIAVKAWNRRHY